MPIGSILLGLALAILVVPFVAAPLIEARRTDGRSPRRALHAGEGTLEVKQSALVALRDLDFDFRTGKILEEDYVPLRGQLLAEAAQALRAEDAAAASHRDWEAEIEAAVRAVRSQRAPGAGAVLESTPAVSMSATCPECQSPTREGDRFCARCGAALGADCPQCHQAIQAADLFCGHCGAPLHTGAISVS